MNSSTHNNSPRTNELPGLREQFQSAFRIVFRLDLRSLALFRVALGVLIICDLLFRSGTLTEMYTDDGFFTRQVAFDYYLTNWGEGWNTIFWSVYWLGGGPGFTMALFAIAGLFAILLLVGKWTRFATFASWFLLVSLHVRNPVIITSADFQLKLMLFWSFFLPLGRVWSLDALSAQKKGATAPNPNSGLANFATAGIVIQLFILYFFTGLAKWNEGWWTGEAMYYCLGLDIYVKPFGHSLLQYPLLLKFVSIATVVAEVFLIWTLFLAKHNHRFRLLNMAVFWAFHIGIFFSMSIGMFCWICMAAWIPLIPSQVWNYFRKDFNSENATEETPPSTWTYQLQQVFCALLILFVIGWNVGNIETETIQKYRNRLFAKIGYAACLNQHFQMFGQPPRSNPWFVYEAVLEDGQNIDLLTGKDVTRGRAELMRTLIPSFHWRKVHRNLVGEDYASLRKPLANYRMQKWNREHPDNKVSRLRLMYYEQDTGSDALATSNQHSKVWAMVEDEASGAGSLFDQLKNDPDNDPLNLGF